MSKNQIEIYKGSKMPEVRVKLIDGDVWLNRNQISTIFNRDIKTIGKHINNAISEELRDFSVVAKFATTASDGKTYQVEHYNLDVILSVGYRVKSAEGVRFRIWANNVLQKYIKQGVAVNERRLEELELVKLRSVEGTLGVVQRLIKQHELSAGEASGILEVLSKYSGSWRTLENYDNGHIRFPKGQRPTWVLEPKYCLDLIKKMRADLKASSIFGKLKDESFYGAIGAIYQTFDGRDLYPTTAEKAANLLYLLIKDHPFIDGNKRIAAFIFIIFLTMNNYHLTENGECKISDRALVAIALLVAESNPKEKSLITALVGKLLDEK